MMFLATGFAASQTLALFNPVLQLKHKLLDFTKPDLASGSMDLN